MQGATISSMSRIPSFGKFSSTANTVRLDSPDIGGMPFRRPPQQRYQIALRACAALFGLLAMALFAASVSEVNANFVNLDGTGDWTDGLPLAPSVLALLLNPIFILLGLRHSRGPPPAGVRAAADFVIWGLSIPSLLFAILGGVFNSYADAIPEANGTVNCSLWFNSFSTECTPMVHVIGNMQIAGVVFLALLCLAHLALSISDVIDLIERRKKRQSVVPPDFEMTLGGKDVESRPETS